MLFVKLQALIISRIIVLEMLSLALHSIKHYTLHKHALMVHGRITRLNEINIMFTDL